MQIVLNCNFSQHQLVDDKIQKSAQIFIGAVAAQTVPTATESAPNPPAPCCHAATAVKPGVDKCGQWQRQ